LPLLPLLPFLLLLLLALSLLLLQRHLGDALLLTMAAAASTPCRPQQMQQVGIGCMICIITHNLTQVIPINCQASINQATSSSSSSGSITSASSSCSGAGVAACTAGSCTAGWRLYIQQQYSVVDVWPVEAAGQHCRVCQLKAAEYVIPHL
jgi:hypothetical protein